MATVSPKCYLQQKNHVFRPELPKNSLKKASDIPSKLPDSNMTNPLPPFIKKRREEGEKHSILCYPFSFWKSHIWLSWVRGLGTARNTKKRVFFDVPSSKTLFCTLYHARTLQRESEWWFLCTNQWVVGIFAHSTAINHYQRCSRPENISSDQALQGHRASP